MTAEARIRPLRPSDHAPVIAVIDEWWGGRPMAQMLPRLFFDHFTDTSFAADRDDVLAGFLVGFMSPARPGEAYIHFVGVHPGSGARDSAAGCTARSSTRFGAGAAPTCAR